MRSAGFFALHISCQILSVACHGIGRPEHYETSNLGQTFLGSDYPFDEAPQFFGLGTFANLPYVNCLSPSGGEGEYDIALFGAPFDTVSYFILKLAYALC